MGELAEYWKDVKPILKQQNEEHREKHYDERIEYAIKQFEENKIPYKLCNETNGHFNLYNEIEDVVTKEQFSAMEYKVESEVK